MTDDEIGQLVGDLVAHGNAYVIGDDATKATARRVKDMARAEGLRVHYATGRNEAGTRYCVMEVVPR